MTKLKTLDDIEKITYSYKETLGKYVSVKDLKKEARKWLTYIESCTPYMANIYIREFFNIKYKQNMKTNE